MARRSDAILRLIGAFKLVKAVVLLAVGLGALSLIDGGAEHGLKRWVDDFHPANQYVRDAIEKIGAADPHTLRLIGIGTLVYAALFLIEGIGLLARKLWAEYVTTIITTSFVPLEVYEFVEHHSITKAVVTMANIAIVAYLVLRLRSDGNWPFQSPGSAAASMRGGNAM